MTAESCIEGIERIFGKVSDDCIPVERQDVFVKTFEMASMPGREENYNQLLNWFKSLSFMHKIDHAKSELIWRIRPNIEHDFFYTRFAILFKDA